MRIHRIFHELESDFLSLMTQTFDQIDDLVFVMRFTGKDYEYIYANRAAKDTVNLPDLSNPVYLHDVVTESAYKRLFSYYEQARITQEKVLFTAPIEHRGQQIIGESLLTPVYMKEHNFHFILAIVRDITSHEQALQNLKLAQKELEEERLRLESLIEYNNEAIFQVDDNGKIVKCNPEAKRFLNGTSDEIQSTYLSDWFTTNFFSEWFTTVPKPTKNSQHELWITLRNQIERHYIKVKFIPILIATTRQGWYVLVRDATVETTIQDELQRMAFIDHLSGLPNRRAFDDRLDYLLEQAGQTGDYVAVFLLDGYKFKRINDEFGHDTGDAVIRETAHRLEQVVRDQDMVARFGGDEFAIIVPHIKELDIINNMASRILSQFEQPFYYRGKEISISVGIGCSHFPGTAKNKNQLLKEADYALYEIKEGPGIGFKAYKSHP